MYAPRHFATTDLAMLDGLAASHPFATLITIEDGAPFVSHLPVLYWRSGEDVVLRGHWARANPQCRHGGEAKLILHGPQAYVSPSWYPDKESAARVPTWNYAVAHLWGPLRIIEDEVGLASIVSALSERFEAAAGSDWRFEYEREEQRRQLRGIVGFELRPARIELKAKLSQNHPEANRRSVAAALSRGDEQQRAVAAMMSENLTSSNAGT
jgi:transcriptional regulator